MWCKTPGSGKTRRPTTWSWVDFPLRKPDKLGDVKLVPGMPVEVFIRTHERTALSYLVRPVHDQIARAFKEK